MIYTIFGHEYPELIQVFDKSPGVLKLEVRSTVSSRRAVRHVGIDIAHYWTLSGFLSKVPKRHERVLWCLLQGFSNTYVP